MTNRRPEQQAQEYIEEALRTGGAELDLSGLGLTELPESVGQLSQLQMLDLSHTPLKILPESIGQLSQLRMLDLSHTPLKILPESIGQLSQLQMLDLRDTFLTALPGSVGQLSQLQWLNLRGTPLEVLPESIGQLSQLQMLDLGKTFLKSLPESLGQLSQLQELYLHDNILGILPEALGPTRLEVIEKNKKPANPSDILRYYYRIRYERHPLNEAKLILVGFGAVGKTSLVNRLVHNLFDKDSQKTEGIQITQWATKLNSTEEVRLHIWDFGGQEILHATHQFFLTQRSLYLLVLNGRQGHEDADAEYWLNLIASFGKESPVLIVLNKIKEHSFDVNRRALKQKFLSIRDFIRTDCDDRTGIDELLRAIKRETGRLDHLRDAFPKSWLTIKNHLAVMEENYISFDHYRELCAELGEHDVQAQDSLAFYLHNLGIVLNFKDDPRLRDTHVLNPHWVTNGIYAILNAESLAQQQGELRANNVTSILSSAIYPSERHAFLFELMRKFELCFRFSEDDDRYLIPELLNKQQPPAAEEFWPEECLNFQFHYPVLPEGLLPRFIVRTHVLSKDLPRWKTGVILAFEGNRALVKADAQDKRVYISIDGPVESRRRLLAIIRSDFDHIHRSFTFQLEEMVPVPKCPDILVPYQELLVREKHNQISFSIVIGLQIHELEVSALLNGVDLDGARPSKRPSLVLNVFYSYSHRDEELRNELDTHLKILQRQRLINSWHDRKITAGTEWKSQIDANLERADIILLLVSADFIASDYCIDTEMKKALELHKNGKAKVVPVIIRDVYWQTGPFADLQALPADAPAITSWPNRDSAWRKVVEGIVGVVKEIHRERGYSRNARREKIEERQEVGEVKGRK